MLCGPIALSKATGVNLQSIILHIRYLRDQRRQRVSLRGGTTLNELIATARHFGWRVRPVFRHRRVRLRELSQRITTGRWLFLQRRHFFGARSGNHLRRMARAAPNGLVLAGWRIHPSRNGNG